MGSQINVKHNFGTQMPTLAEAKAMWFELEKQLLEEVDKANKLTLDKLEQSARERIKALREQFQKQNGDDKDGTVSKFSRIKTVEGLETVIRGINEKVNVNYADQMLEYDQAKTQYRIGRTNKGTWTGCLTAYFDTEHLVWGRKSVSYSHTYIWDDVRAFMDDQEHILKDMRQNFYTRCYFKDMRINEKDVVMKLFAPEAGKRQSVHVFFKAYGTEIGKEESLDDYDVWEARIDKGYTEPAAEGDHTPLGTWRYDPHCQWLRTRKGWRKYEYYATMYVSTQVREEYFAQNHHVIKSEEKQGKIRSEIAEMQKMYDKQTLAEAWHESKHQAELKLYGIRRRHVSRDIKIVYTNTVTHNKKHEASRNGSHND